MKSVKIFLLFYNAHNFFKEFVLLYPVYMLLFESKGLSFLEISLLLVIWSASVILLEIPSGMLADRWSRKTMLVAGSVFKLACFVLWLLADGFVLFAAGFVLWGMQEAMCSGAAEAVLFETLEQHGLSEDYEKHTGKAGFWAGMGLVMAMLLGGYAAATGFGLAAVGSVASLTISLLTALLLKEPPKGKGSDDTEEPPMGFKELLARCRSNKAIAVILLFCAGVVIVPGVLEEYDQLYAQQLGLSLGQIGIWGALRIGAESLGRRFAYKLKRLFDSVGRLCWLGIAGGLLLLVSAYGFSMYLLPVYALFYALVSGGHVLAEGMLQRLAASEHRATLLSINSLLMNVASIAVLLGFSGLSDGMGLRIGFIIMALFLVLTALLTMLFGRKAKNVEPQL